MIDYHRIIEDPTNFFPKLDDTMENQIYAIIRASIYSGILLSIIKLSIIPLILPIIVIIASYFINQLYELRKKKETKEKFSNIQRDIKFVKPSRDNPFMNYLVTNYHKDQQSGDLNIDKKACPIYQRDVSRNVNSLMNKINPDDIFDRGQSQGRFYTMPNTNIVNDQRSFAEFLTKDMTNCKDNNGDCYRGI
jgi:hypothetical protein